MLAMQASSPLASFQNLNKIVFLKGKTKQGTHKPESSSNPTNLKRDPACNSPILTGDI
jgi:hypothetical protein